MGTPVPPPCMSRAAPDTCTRGGRGTGLRVAWSAPLSFPRAAPSARAECRVSFPQLRALLPAAAAHGRAVRDWGWPLEAHGALWSSGGDFACSQEHLHYCFLIAEIICLLKKIQTLQKFLSKVKLRTLVPSLPELTL